MLEMRILGDNVAFLLKQKSEALFMAKLGFEKQDVARIKEGRLILRPQDIEAIANFFGTTREDLFVEHPERSQVHIVGEADRDAVDEVLDKFDVYCDLAEVTERRSTAHKFTRTRFVVARRRRKTWAPWRTNAALITR